MHNFQQALDALLADTDIQKLKKASSEITDRYRAGGTLFNHEELLAYLIVRMPATFAALRSVLSHLPSSGSFLDFGAGPGTLYWAALSVWDMPPLVTAVEREAKFIDIGKKLGSQCSWIQGDLLSFEHFEPHDWAIFGYSLGELPEDGLPSLLSASWKAAQKGVVIVEPGTPRGYQRMLLARDYLIRQGGFVIAPCPHSKTCPMQFPDWCHFSVRLERTELHRRAKLATLGYEDEKFSYVILTKEKPSNLPSRIIATPKRRSGHVILPLCTSSGLQEITVARSQKELYKKVRKADWGDSYSESAQGSVGL